MLPFWIALQFLSSLPVRLPGMPAAEQMWRSLLFYPVVGLLFGVLLWAFDSRLAASPLLLHAALLLTLWVLLSGALHLDGLADSADAWLGGFGDRERTLTIMKDPRSGPIAVVTLVLVLLLKFTALLALVQAGQSMALLLAPLIGRAAMLGLFLFGRAPAAALRAHRLGAQWRGLCAARWLARRAGTVAGMCCVLLAAQPDGAPIGWHHG